jgi:hypothetical protein
MSLAADLGLVLDTRLHIDAAAALGILERRGVGKIRHLDVGALWLQEVQLRQKVAFMKIKGTSNPADLMTKHLPKDPINEYMEKLGFDFRDGRADVASKLHVAAHAPASLAKTQDLRGGCTASAHDTTTTTTTRTQEGSSDLEADAAPLPPPAAPPEARPPTGEARPSPRSRQLPAPGEAERSTAGTGGNYSVAAEITANGHSRKGWRRAGERTWIGVFKGARAHRLPPGIGWQEVSARRTQDAASGEVLEDVETTRAPFSSAMAGRRLDRVRDIETRVTLHSGPPPPLPPPPPKPRWADICSDSDEELKRRN